MPSPSFEAAPLPLALVLVVSPPGSEADVGNTVSATRRLQSTARLGRRRAYERYPKPNTLRYPLMINVNLNVGTLSFKQNQSNSTGLIYLRDLYTKMRDIMSECSARRGVPSIRICNTGLKDIIRPKIQLPRSVKRHPKYNPYPWMNYRNPYPARSL